MSYPECRCRTVPTRQPRARSVFGRAFDSANGETPVPGDPERDQSADTDSGNDSALNEKYATQQNGFMLIDPEKKFKPKVFNENVFFKEGETYNLSDHEKTLKRLINLNEFKFKIYDVVD